MVVNTYIITYTAILHNSPIKVQSNISSFSCFLLFFLFFFLNVDFVRKSMQFNIKIAIYSDVLHKRRSYLLIVHFLNTFLRSEKGLAFHICIGTRLPVGVQVG